MLKSIISISLFSIIVSTVNGQKDNIIKERIKRFETHLTPSLKGVFDNKTQNEI